MVQLAFWFGAFAGGMLFMSIGISNAGESEAQMLREWRRIGIGLLVVAAACEAIAIAQAT